jgi:lysophosphatidate acyltransferase
MYSPIYYLLLLTSSYLAVTLFLFTMSSLLPTTPILGFLARLLSSYASLLVCATYGVFASLFLRLIGQHRLAQYATARSFDLVMRYTTGVRFVIVEGEEYLTSKRPMVIIGNHQTELDVLFLGRIFPRYCSVTAKKSLARVPFLGWFMSLSGTVFIDRVDRSQAMKAFEGAAREMKEHRQNVFIFPEGTRSYAREPVLLPFKKGAFHLAVQAGVDVCPVVAENYSRVLDVAAKRFVEGTIRVKGERLTVASPSSSSPLCSTNVVLYLRS